MFSPFSVQTAFSMLYPATDPEETNAKEFAATLGFDSHQSTFHAAMNGHLLAVNEAFAEAPPEAMLRYTLVSQVWTDEAFGLQNEYLDTIKRFYTSGVGVLPLRASSEASRTTINSFIAANTNDLINNLIPPEVTKDTAAILTNSVYMLADWATEFKKKDTHPVPFTNADGSVVSPETMHMTQVFDYVVADSFTALSLDYVGDRVAMMIVLPNVDKDFSDFATSFGGDEYRSAVDNLSPARVAVGLPKFTLEWGATSLKEALNQLGMVQAFEADQNNFPLMLTRNGGPAPDPIYIQDVFHKAKVIVDENGTEAAEATAIVAGTSSAPAEPDVSFVVDRPALFFIYEKAHKGIIFAGRLSHL